MYKIVNSRFINPSVKLFEIEAPTIAANRRAKAGQFIILRVSEDGERIPITIADCNPETKTITIIVQGIGKTTKLLLTKEKGDSIMDIVGPLGKPTHIEKFGICVVIGGGVGTAIAYPTAKALKEAGNKVIVIIGGRTSELAILHDEISAFADEVYITTDDGSAGEKGLVTDKLRSLINTGVDVNYVLAIGPIMMMKAVADTTNITGNKIPTVVSLNPVMLDGTGMCGGCRALVGGKNVFVCVDGPEFDAHEVDFETLLKRNATYSIQENCSLCKFKEKYEM
jgi:ferredoxin--NADP+ reductase